MSFLPPSLSSIFLHYPEAFTPELLARFSYPTWVCFRDSFCSWVNFLGFRAFPLLFFCFCASLACILASSLLFLNGGSSGGEPWHNRAPWAGNSPSKEGLSPKDPLHLQLRVLGKLGFRKDDYPTMPLTLLNCTTTYPMTRRIHLQLITPHSSMTLPRPLDNFFRNILLHQLL